MVAILLGTGFEEIEAITPGDLLRRAGIEVRYVGVSGKTVEGGHGIKVQCDCTLEELTQEPQMVVLPGGLGGVASLKASQKALDLVTDTYRRGGFVAAICAGPTILAQLGITEDKQVTCYPGFEPQMGNAVCTQQAAVRSGKVITGTSAGCATGFGLALIEALKGKEKADTVKNQIVLR